MRIGEVASRASSSTTTRSSAGMKPVSTFSREVLPVPVQVLRHGADRDPAGLAIEQRRDPFVYLLRRADVRQCLEPRSGVNGTAVPGKREQEIGEGLDGPSPATERKDQPHGDAALVALDPGLEHRHQRRCDLPHLPITHARFPMGRADPANAGAFIDDDPAKTHRWISGVPVRGALDAVYNGPDGIPGTADDFDAIVFSSVLSGAAAGRSGIAARGSGRARRSTWAAGPSTAALAPSPSARSAAASPCSAVVSNSGTAASSAPTSCSPR